jgi:nucleoside-diphosphate-sugar epimerase
MKLLIFGMGYTAQAMLDAWPTDWPRDVTVTTRSPEKARGFAQVGLTARIFPGDDLSDDIATATHVLITAGPSEGRDPTLARLSDAFADAKHLEWVGYLSTTGVYGDHGGGWVDEDTPLTPSTARGRARVAAEGGMAGASSRPWPAAPYLPPCRDLRPRSWSLRQGQAGTARRIVKPGRSSAAATWRISRRS